MKKVLEISFKSDDELYENDSILDYSVYKNELSFYYTANCFESVASALTKENFYKGIEYKKENPDLFLDEDCEITPEITDILDDIISNIDTVVFKIYDICDYITEESVDIISNYLKNNPELMNKKIIIDYFFTVKDYNIVKYILEKFDFVKDKLYVNMVNNNERISITECYQTISKVKEKADIIKSLNLSPIETIMYVYDEVRNRVYTSEEEGESHNKSRDLSKVLNGDKIVCVGYANYFDALLYYLDINDNKFKLEKKNESIGHQRNGIYVKDDKYDIDGFYFFDATFDSKKKDEINEFLYRYNYFARTGKEMASDDDGNYKASKSNALFAQKYLKTALKLLKEGKYEEFRKRYLSFSNFYSEIILHKILIHPLAFFEFRPSFVTYDIDEVISNLEIIISKFNNPISAEKYIEILKNVRKQEYYIDPEFYPYNIDALYKTYRISDWKFSKHYYSNQEKLLRTIFNAKLEDRDDVTNDFISYAQDNELCKETKQVILTRTLRKHLNERMGRKND